MRIAYLIMVHENPQLLQRTIRTLSFGDEECGFFIHLDAKTTDGSFSSVSGQNVRFSEKRIPVYWGEFSQVQATLLLVRQAVESPTVYDYCVFIQGSCYPLRTGGYIRRYLEANRGLEYTNILKVPGPGSPISRFDTIRYPSSRPVRRFAFRVLSKIGLAQRDHRIYLGGLEPYSGEATWAFTREACQYVLNFNTANPQVEKYFQDMFAPDETFWHTILGNSKFRDRMRRDLVYVDWSLATDGSGHPELISHEHVASFEVQHQVSRSDMYGPGELLFARKFNDSRLDVVRRVEAMIERKERVRLSATDQGMDGSNSCNALSSIHK
jgi:hypothetical protein